MKNNLGSKELREIEDLLDQLQQKSDQLTDWEQKFVDDCLSRFEQYGDRTFFSRKQAESVYKMQEKYL